MPANWSKTSLGLVHWRMLNPVIATPLSGAEPVPVSASTPYLTVASVVTTFVVSLGQNGSGRNHWALRVVEAAPCWGCSKSRAIAAVSCAAEFDGNKDWRVVIRILSTTTVAAPPGVVAAVAKI